MLRSNLWDYSDAYIVVKGTITVTSTNNSNQEIKRQLSRIMLHDHAYQKLNMKGSTPNNNNILNAEVVVP